MKTKWLKFVLALSLVLNISFLAAAGYTYYENSGDWLSPFGFKIKKGRFLFEQLSLKPGQFEAMRARAVPFRAEIDKKRNAILKKREELFNLLRADNPDRKAIDARISEINGMQADMQRAIVAHILDMKTILDKDQGKKFLDLIENAMKDGKGERCPATAR
ncbi:MAG: periplasmic heavy metal sensor [Nitrospiraceae bacterium]|nr:periplasmic heavy metal sensor [Nitrospiraceae bacterium]